MKYSYFSNIRSKQCRQVSVAELFELIKLPALKMICDGIAEAVSKNDDGEANRLKATLPVIVLNELYDQNAPRKKGTGKPTGLVMIDYDNCKDADELQALKEKVVQLALSHPQLKDLIVAAHVSPRQHGVHVWYRWIDGCHDIKECHKKFAEMADLPDYDEGCNDSSRCSYLVDSSRFFVQNWGAMEHNEEYAELQKKLTKNGRNSEQHEPRAIAQSLPMADSDSGNTPVADGVGSNDPAKRVEADPLCPSDISPSMGRSLPDGSPLPIEGEGQGERVRSFPTTYEGIEYSQIFKELTLKCCPASKIDQEGNVLEGARDNTLFKVVVLFRYICDNKPDWIEQYLPDWAKGLDADKPGRCRELIESACFRSMTFTTPRTLASVLKALKQGEQTAETEAEKQENAVKELTSIEESQKKFFEVPAELPPVFQEYVNAFPFAWKPAAILALLPMLGTIMSRIRGVYLDHRMHSPSFQTVVEAKFGRGKGNITDMARVVLEPLVEADEIGNTQLNQYNKLVEKANGTEKLPDKPDVCVRKITGDFTVAGFEEILNTSKGLHIWCGTSEIDEVRKVWAAVSHILRKAYDNDMYGRSLQSTKTFRGERPIFFNTLLCGTSRAVKRCYTDPEDGLVSRTMFFKLMRDDKEMPVVRMNVSTKNRLSQLLHQLHDTYSLSPDGTPVLEKRFDMEFVNRSLRKWLNNQYDKSVVTGNEARDSFRRRDAVNGFRAGLVAVAIYNCMGRKIGKREQTIVNNFAKWVASYSLEMHLLKYGNALNQANAEEETVNKDCNVLSVLPSNFTLSEAYRTFSGMSQSGVRVMLHRLVSAGYLESEQRGVYSKK